MGLLFATPGLMTPAPAEAQPDGVAELVAAVANANQKLQELGAAIQAEQEGVNKAIVDVQTARDNAAAAQREVDASKLRVEDANRAIEAAQQRFDKFAAAAYVNGPSDSYLTASDPAIGVVLLRWQRTTSRKNRGTQLGFHHAHRTASKQRTLGG
ncbi:hypothetical protein BHQ17_22030 [Mycolicibacterium holsaticum]|uniref:Uncharacterized protein n=1 Tax=Mycolicibacterium holsaticum TaxID=152142 RepID=A0A1E3R796_9MYCO|nr:hypothetical protein BHQ17_22030 [Mycolicibacterium holsaticum]